MKIYQSNKPLIFLHIPKTAGIACQSHFMNWYENGFFPHYYANQLPPKQDLKQEVFRKQPSIIYGHFNAARGFGADQYYPAVDQFVTILRDPWERAVSGYFYLRKTNRLNAGSSDGGIESIEEFLMKGPDDSILNHHPKGCSIKNFKEIIEKYFVEIGITEKLEESLFRIAEKLGFNFDPSTLKEINKAPRDQEVPVHLKNEFMEKRALEYSLYEYVLSKYK